MDERTRDELSGLRRVFENRRIISARKAVQAGHKAKKMREHCKVLSDGGHQSEAQRASDELRELKFETAKQQHAYRRATFLVELCEVGLMPTSLEQEQ